MRLLSAAAILVLALVLTGTPAGADDAASFRPPPIEGTIYAVVGVHHNARTTKMTVTWGPFKRTVGRANPYGLCVGKGGFVLKLHHVTPQSLPFRLTTTGEILRPLYQGAAPPEARQPCFKIQAMRARQ